MNPLALVSTIAPAISAFLQTTRSSRAEALPPGFMNSQLDTMLQAAVTGIGVYFSSGDSGDETGGNPSNAAVAMPEWPVSSRW